MKHFSIKILLLFALLLSATSCVSKQKLTYLQYSGIGDGSELALQDLRVSVTPAAYKLMPYDILYIRVMTPDPQWSAIFNASAGEGSGGNITTESASLLGYPVNDIGNIEIPFVGKVNVAGKTLSETKTRLDSIFKNYLNDAAITVRLVNNYISIIGEVNRPGRYPLTKDRINVFEALSMAGDLNLFSNRQKIQLIRPSPYGPVIKEFSLNDRSILTSEFYFIMPNDIIYAQPMRRRSFDINSSFTQILVGSFTTIMSAITTLFVILNYNNQ